ncbi:MAG TPA: glycosyltransferase family 1 protein [Methylibium sp.]|uniref:glycosyltransferase family 4 protein n=1 Tax=Methylibium sp. TaxID=2067992 RepID=UPI002DB907E8|nr:glycosyltransferase family 1 protein [Methylibium sp.]HEU4459106.1 glycosyltransferase family 1 protein [Methylibium sp.]
MRIAYVTETYPPEINGVALTVERCVAHLRARHGPVLLVRPRQRDEAARDDAEEWRTAGAPIPMYPALRFGWATAGAVRRRLGRFRPDLVHVATPGPLGHAAARAAVAMGLPLTIDFRTNFHSYSRYYGLGLLEPMVCRYLRSLHDRADCSFVPTRAMVRQLEAQGFDRLAVVGRGVDARRFTPAKRSAALRLSWGARDDAPVLIGVGRLAAEKNVALALAAFDAVKAANPRARLVLVGDGPLEARLRAQRSDVIFAGVQRGEALAMHYASADLMLFPSESETFGNVTLEAMASGLAVVAFDLAAAAEHIVDGASGWLAPPGDAQAYVQTALTAALAAPEDTRPLRRRAREHALAHGWPEVLETFAARLARHAMHGATERWRDVALA